MSEPSAEKGAGSVGRILDVLSSWMMHVAMFSLAMIMLLTAADAFARYVLNLPITGAVEFTGEYLLVAAVSFAMAYTYRDGHFVRVTFFVSKLPPGVRFILDHIIQAACALVCIVYVYAEILQLQRIYADHTTTIGYLAYVLWPAYTICVLGLALLAPMVTADLLKVRRGQSALFKREKETGEESIAEE